MQLPSVRQIQTNHIVSPSVIWISFIFSHLLSRFVEHLNLGGSFLGRKFTLNQFIMIINSPPPASGAQQRIIPPPKQSRQEMKMHAFRNDFIGPIGRYAS